MKKVLAIGGAGFLGGVVARQLAAAGFHLLLPTRRREHAKHLTVLPTVEVVEADVHDEATLARLMEGKAIVINMVGILRGDFQRVHVELPAKIGRAAAQAGVGRLLHVSALGAAADGPSQYLRSKAAGEAALRAAYPQATIFRPSVIFGRGDSFLSLFARLSRIAPVIPLACPNAEFQPVWVEDVAAAMVASLSEPAACGRSYPLCGPRRYTLRELVRLAGEFSGRRRLIIGLPRPLGYLQALMTELVGGPMTRDNFYSLQAPNVCPEGSTLPFGLSPTPLEAVAPTYLAAL